MKITNYINDNTLLIVPNSYKEHILKELDMENRLFNIKFMTIEELTKKYYFDYDEKTILWLMNKYSIKRDVALIYIKNMYYLNGCYYESDKLNELTLKKNYLIKNNLLVIDEYFNNYLKSKNILVYGYNNLDKFYLNMLDKIKIITNVNILYDEEYSKKDLEVYEFNNIDLEVSFIARKIIEIKNKNISLNNIKLVGVDSLYENTIKKIFKMYNININFKSKGIYYTEVAHKFLMYIEKGLDFDKALEEISKEYQSSKSKEIINKIVEVCNKYTWFNDDKYKIIDLLIEDFKNKSIKEVHYEEEIQVINLYNDYIDDNDYVFIMGFNNGVYPMVVKDEHFIGDKLKKELDLDTSIDINIKNKAYLINLLYKLDKLFITYKLNAQLETFHPSVLVEELSMKKIVESDNSNISYSREYDNLLLAMKLDKLIKTNEKDEDLSKYFYSNKDILYRVYNNNFTSIPKEKLYKYLNNKLNVSYTSLDNYAKCSFRYYINNILKIDKYENSFNSIIGKIFHSVLQNFMNDNFNFDEFYDNEVSKYNLSKKELFFINRLKKELEISVGVIKEQHTLSGFTKYLLEEEVKHKLDKEIDVVFKGIIDKIMYKDEDRTLLSIVDYKTGDVSGNLGNTIYGLGMQLPVYIYLVSKINKFKNIRISGFYLQKILSNEITKNMKQTYLEQKRDNLKLTGYSNSDVSLISKFDPTYEDSTMISSLKLTNDGNFYSYSKVISDDDINKLIDVVDKVINQEVDDILSCKFDINPKRIDNENIGCSFCEYKDICFMNEKNIKDLKKYKNLDFLKEEE